MSLSGEGRRTSTIVLAPDGEQVAYVSPGTSPELSASLWPKSGNTLTPPQQKAQPDSVWVAPVDGSQQPRPIFDLPSASGPGGAANPERIVDLVWTPDGSRLAAITRQTGQPARARVFVLNVTVPGDVASSPLEAAQELVLLPAEIVSGSAVPDPRGRWLALVAHSASAPGGRDVLNIFVLELRPGGIFRDLADLGSAATAPSTAPTAWPPRAEGAPDRLVFVGPAPAAASGGGGPFGIFSALRPATPPLASFKPARRLRSPCGLAAPPRDRSSRDNDLRNSLRGRDRQAHARVGAW